MLTPDQCRPVVDSFLFSGVEEGFVAEFLSQLSPVSFEKGEVVYSAHSFRRSIGFVLSGELAVTKGEHLLLNQLGAGDCFGVAALFHPVESYVTTITAAKPAQVVFVSDGELRQLFAAQPATAVNYISFLSQRIGFLNRKIDAFTAPSAEAGLAIYLLDNSREGTVQITGGYAQLARKLGMGRASLYRCLDQLEERKILQRRERAITILDPETLKTLCPNR